MIGQTELLSRINNDIKNGKFPRFSIIVGDKGSGKKLVARYIGRQLGLSTTTTQIDTKVDAIREMIDNAYKTITPALYIIADADDMSVAAKNAMLKVTEEPPNNAYFIITLNDLANTLDTIKSRGTVYNINPYTHNDITDYVNQKYPPNKAALSADDVKAIANLCETPYEVDLLVNYTVSAFCDYVNLVIDNIAVVSGANSFKIADKINLKDDNSKYDLKLFWKAFISFCMNRIHDDKYRYIKGVSITSKYLQELRVNGINLQMAFDEWLLDIRQEWIKWEDE